MIRDLLCPVCAKATREIFPRDNPERGGYVKFVSGKAAKPILCFQCYAMIGKGMEATAFSVFTDERTYEPWEGDYLNLDRQNQERTRCKSSK